MARISLKMLPSSEWIATKCEGLHVLINKNTGQYSKLDTFVFRQNQKYFFEPEEVLETLSGWVPSFPKSVTETSLRANVFPMSHLTS